MYYTLSLVLMASLIGMATAQNQISCYVGGGTTDQGAFMSSVATNCYACYKFVSSPGQGSLTISGISNYIRTCAQTQTGASCVDTSVYGYTNALVSSLQWACCTNLCNSAPSMNQPIIGASVIALLLTILHRMLFI